MIFNAKNFKDEFKSFSAPFVSMNEVKLEQPTFGANYIKGMIAAQQNGGFTGETRFKLSFKAGGAIDFGQAMLRAASMARSNSHGYAPPPYEPPAGMKQFFNIFFYTNKLEIYLLCQVFV